MAYKQQTFISHHSGGQKSEMREPAQWVLVRALLQAADFSPCHHTVESREEHALSCEVDKGTYPIHKSFTLMTLSISNYLQRSHIPYHHSEGVRVSTYGFGGGQKIFHPLQLLSNKAHLSPRYSQVCVHTHTHTLIHTLGLLTLSPFDVTSDIGI